MPRSSLCQKVVKTLVPSLGNGDCGLVFWDIAAKNGVRLPGWWEIFPNRFRRRGLVKNKSSIFVDFAQ